VPFRDILICTVGTSLKGNLERIEEMETRSLWEKKNFQGLSLRLMGYPSDDRLLGAEINSITSILAKAKLQEQTRLHLLVSDTPDGIFIGRVIKSYYENPSNPFRFNQVELKTLAGLTDESPQKFRTEGLRNLVREISRIVQREGAQRIVINATGGYKAQISFAGMIGQALGIPVCYLFERFSEVIDLPPQPVSLDLSFWLEHAAHFFELAADQGSTNPADQDERFASLVDTITVDGETLIGLSPVGQLFHETFRHRFGSQKADLLPPGAKEKKGIRYEDKNNEKHPGLKNFLERLLALPYVFSIYTHYYNPDLPLANYFRPSREGVDHIEGGYSNGKAATKFDLITTAKTTAQRDAVLADLSERTRLL
jgi:putative CRISPR-associated protein (TIGR02619 family)